MSKRLYTRLIRNGKRKFSSINFLIFPLLPGKIRHLIQIQLAKISTRVKRVFERRTQE